MVVETVAEKITEPIGIMSKPSTRIKEENQFSQFKYKFTKAIIQIRRLKLHSYGEELV